MENRAGLFKKFKYYLGNKMKTKIVGSIWKSEHTENDVWGEAWLGEGQIFGWIDAWANTFLTVAGWELVTDDRVTLEGHHDGHFIQWTGAVIAA